LGDLALHSHNLRGRLGFTGVLRSPFGGLGPLLSQLERPTGLYGECLGLRLGDLAPRSHNLRGRLGFMGVFGSPFGGLGPSLSQLERPTGLYEGAWVSVWGTWPLALTT
jgi:hypothetical protein